MNRDICNQTELKQIKRQTKYKIDGWMLMQFVNEGDYGKQMSDILSYGWGGEGICVRILVKV